MVLPGWDLGLRSKGPELSGAAVCSCQKCCEAAAYRVVVARGGNAQQTMGCQCRGMPAVCRDLTRRLGRLDADLEVTWRVGSMRPCGERSCWRHDLTCPMKVIFSRLLLSCKINACTSLAGSAAACMYVHAVEPMQNAIDCVRYISAGVHDITAAAMPVMRVRGRNDHVMTAD